MTIIEQTVENCQHLRSQSDERFCGGGGYRNKCDENRHNFADNGQDRWRKQPLPRSQLSRRMGKGFAHKLADVRLRQAVMETK